MQTWSWIDWGFFFFWNLRQTTLYGLFSRERDFFEASSSLKPIFFWSNQTFSNLQDDRDDILKRWSIFANHFVASQISMLLLRLISMMMNHSPFTHPNTLVESSPIGATDRMYMNHPHQSSSLIDNRMTDEDWLLSIDVWSDIQPCSDCVPIYLFFFVWVSFPPLVLSRSCRRFSLISFDFFFSLVCFLSLSLSMIFDVIILV